MGGGENASKVLSGLSQWLGTSLTFSGGKTKNAQPPATRSSFGSCSFKKWPASYMISNFIVSENILPRGRTRFCRAYSSYKLESPSQEKAHKITITKLGLGFKNIKYVGIYLNKDVQFFFAEKH